MAPSYMIDALYILLLLAALMDIWLLRIANFFPVAIVILFCGWVYSCGFDRALWQNVAMFGATLAGATFLFSRGWFGGGDAKLLAAIALWFDFTGGAAFFLYVSLGGALLALTFMLLRRLLPPSLAEKHDIRALKARGPIPYGIAISAGAALAILGGHVHPKPDSWRLLMEQIHHQSTPGASHA